MKQDKNQQTNVTYFLPDFCQSTTVFRIIISTELIVFILFIILTAGQAVFYWDWVGFGLLSFFIQWISVSCIVVLCLLRKYMRYPSIVLFVTLSMTACALIIGLASCIVFYLPLHHPLFASEHTLTISLSRNITVGLVIMGFILRYAYVQHQLALQQQAELKARLQALRAKVHPHFLFNSLNNIVSLIHEDPDLAEQLIEDLSVLLRASLSDDTYLVVLTKEVDLAKRYLHLEKKRLEERLQIDWNLPEQLPETVKVPYMLLQPLLENAIKHGIAPCSKTGKVSISLKINTDSLYIKISNSLPQNPVTNSDGCGIGIKNVRDRLRAHFEDKASLTYLKSHDQYKVCIRIPYNKQQSPPNEC